MFGALKKQIQSDVWLHVRILLFWDASGEAGVLNQVLLNRRICDVLR